MTIGDITEVRMTPGSYRNLRGLEDPLALLAATIPVKYEKSATIYSESEQTGHLHLIVSGRVKVSRRTAGRSIVVGVYGPEEFIGECALLDLERLPEEAVALEKTEVMRWTKSEIEELVLDKPLLGLAFMQTLARRTIDLGTRLQDCLGQTTAERVLQSLVRLCARYGAAGAGGSVYLLPLTHQQIPDYTGTSRGIVRRHMNEFRHQGLLDYWHQGIVLSPRAFQVAERCGHRQAHPDTVAFDGAAA